MENFHCKLYIEKKMARGQVRLSGWVFVRLKEEVLSDGWEPELLEN
jgi:hypothetical protein